MSAGKGDKPRPVNKTRYDANFAAINWKSRSNGRGTQGNLSDRSAAGAAARDKTAQSDVSRREPS